MVVVTNVYRRYPTCSHNLLIKLKNAPDGDDTMTLLHASTTQYRLWANHFITLEQISLLSFTQYWQVVSKTNMIRPFRLWPTIGYRWLHAFWPFNVIDLCTNRKPIYDFPLVISCDLSLISPRFRDITPRRKLKTIPPQIELPVVGIDPLRILL